MRFQKAGVGAFQREKGVCWDAFLAFDDVPPPNPDLAHRMDLSSRCHGSPHIPATPMLWQSGPAAEKPLPRGQARPPT